MVIPILNTSGILGSGSELCRATNETLPRGLFHQNNCVLLPQALLLSSSSIQLTHLLSRVHLRLPGDSLLHTFTLLPASLAVATRDFTTRSHRPRRMELKRAWPLTLATTGSKGFLCNVWGAGCGWGREEKQEQKLTVQSGL